MKRKSLILLLIITTILIAIVISGYRLYYKIYLPNVTVPQGKTVLFIPTGSDFEEVVERLNQQHLLLDTSSFRWMARQSGYDSKVKSGKYLVKDGMSNKELVTMLRSGRQEPVKVVFHNLRLKEQLAGVVAKQIEADSLSLIRLISDSTYTGRVGLNAENALSLFIPNTYEFYWNTSPENFLERMTKEYITFWNEQRMSKLSRTGLSRSEVSVLASIVEQETRMNDEKPIVAGVYLNRLRKNWKLEADPTLIYATRDFGARRVLNIHKEINSPYNTYKYTGLPPGPICMPSIASIDAVLNYQEHEYMFFCARDDFSGYHSFARTYGEHVVNAQKFRNELNRRNIRS